MNDLGYNALFESMARFIGQTVTIFTTSGGISGCGFTGVLVFVDCHVVRLLVEMGAPPACPIGSACTCGPVGCCDQFTGCNPLGAICEIPICSVACFTHNAI